jgi:hypothetical protein
MLRVQLTYRRCTHFSPKETRRKQLIRQFVGMTCRALLRIAGLDPDYRHQDAYPDLVKRKAESCFAKRNILMFGEMIMKTKLTKASKEDYARKEMAAKRATPPAASSRRPFPNLLARDLVS